MLTQNVLLDDADYQYHNDRLSFSLLSLEVIVGIEYNKWLVVGV